MMKDPRMAAWALNANKVKEIVSPARRDGGDYQLSVEMWMIVVMGNYDGS
jgi:hypothetical protein